MAPAAEPETAAAPSSQPSGPEADSASTAAGAPAVEGGTPQPPAAAAAADCVFDEDVAALLQAVPPRCVTIDALALLLHIVHVHVHV